MLQGMGSGWPSIIPPTPQWPPSQEEKASAAAKHAAAEDAANRAMAELLQVIDYMSSQYLIAFSHTTACILGCEVECPRNAAMSLSARSLAAESMSERCTRKIIESDDEGLMRFIFLQKIPQSKAKQKHLARCRMPRMSRTPRRDRQPSEARRLAERHDPEWLQMVSLRCPPAEKAIRCGWALRL